MIDFKLNSKIDSAYGAVIASFISISVFMGSLIPWLMTGPYSPEGNALWIIALIWAILSEGWLIITALVSLIRMKHPIGLTIAVLQPKVPILIRPLLSLWWFLHALIGVIFGITLMVINIHAPWYGHALLIVTSGGIAYMAYVYIMLSVTAFTKSPAILAKVWNLRSWWGGLACLITFLIPLIKIQ